jgi:hypothetical protein
MLHGRREEKARKTFGIQPGYCVVCYIEGHDEAFPPADLIPMLLRLTPRKKLGLGPWGLCAKIARGLFWLRLPQSSGRGPIWRAPGGIG